MPRKPLAPLTHHAIPDRIFDRISKAIVSGKLQSGDRLVESAVAAEMGVSQTSVREAFGQLERHGLLVKRPRKGTYVRTWNRQDLLEVATLRSVLEGLAARLAVVNTTPEDVASLSQKIAEMKVAMKREDYDALIELDIAFHREVWALAGHQSLQQMLEGMRLQIKLSMIITRPYDVLDYATQHQLYLDALCSGHPEIAEQQAREHVMMPAGQVLGAMPDKRSVAMGIPSG